MRIEVSQSGMGRIMSELARLGAFDGSKETRRALSDAANMVASAGRNTLSARQKGGTGSLLGSITARVKQGSAGSLAGFTRSTRHMSLSNAGNHAHLVDRGTRQRRGRGKMPANWFWTDAVNSTSAAALKRVRDGMKKAMDKIMGQNGGTI